MTRKRPRNRTVTECRKFKAMDPQTKTAIKIYCHVDREFDGAAIEAMRQPSQSMLLAWIDQQDYGGSKTLLGAKYTAMIDAALNEDPEVK